MTVAIAVPTTRMPALSWQLLSTARRIITWPHPWEKPLFLMSLPVVILSKCQGGDSNPYGFLHQILSLARLPIPPPRLVDYEVFTNYQGHYFRFVLEFVLD